MDIYISNKYKLNIKLKDILNMKSYFFTRARYSKEAIKGEYIKG